MKLFITTVLKCRDNGNAFRAVWNIYDGDVLRI